jgi:Na+/phosphate symporter
MLTLALLLMVFGLILYFAPTNAKINEVGRIMFQVGLFFVVWQVGGRGLRF